MSKLRIQQLERTGLKPATLTIDAGECVCLSGPSGAGKTLLLRTIADLDPHAGETYLDETASHAMTAPQWRKQVGLLTAESQWWQDNVAPHFDVISPEQWRQLGFEPEAANWQVARLSTGERQRLALLRLLSRKPEALLLDEPTASLDPENVGRVESLIQDYQKMHQIPVLWVSHDVRQIKRLAHRHFRMIDGGLEQVT